MSVAGASHYRGLEDSFSGVAIVKYTNPGH